MNTPHLVEFAAQMSSETDVADKESGPGMDFTHYVVGDLEVKIKEGGSVMRKPNQTMMPQSLSASRMRYLRAQAMFPY